MKAQSHIETIECPECHLVQEAKVGHGIPFNSYVHECKNCKYIIMESEWNQTKGGE
jgi:rubredoxin